MTHFGEQLVRFARLFAFAFVPQALAFDWNHLDRSVVIAAAIAAAETAFRQFFKVSKPVK